MHEQLEGRVMNENEIIDKETIDIKNEDQLKNWINSGLTRTFYLTTNMEINDIEINFCNLKKGDIFYYKNKDEFESNELFLAESDAYINEFGLGEILVSPW